MKRIGCRDPLSAWLSFAAAGLIVLSVVPADAVSAGDHFLVRASCRSDSAVVRDHFLIRALAAAEAGHVELARAVVEEGMERAPDAPHGWLLVARVRGELGDYAGAVDAYHRAEQEVPLLGDCAILGIGDLAYSCGYFDEAASACREGLEKYPDSSHRNKMLLGLGRAAAMAEDREDARDALQAFLDGGGTGDETVEVSWLLAQVLMDLKDWAGAYRVYEVLWEDHPATPEGEAAGDAIRSLGGRYGLTRTRLSAEQMFERGGKLRGGGRFAEAIDQFEEILKSSPDHSILPEVLHEIGSTYFRQAKNRQAIDTLKLLLKRYPDSDPAPDALYLIARTYWRKGFRHHFLSTIEKVRESYPGSRAAESAEFALGVFYAERGKEDKARAALRRVASGPRAHSRRRDALWDLGRMDYREKKYEDAYRSFSDLAAEDSGYRKAATYWAGRSLLRMGRRDEAGELLARLAAESPGHYYGIAASRRLEDVGTMVTKLQAPPESPIDFSLPAGWGGEPYVRILLLEEVGFYDLAMEEMRTLVKDAPPGARLKFARLAQRAGEYRTGTNDLENYYGRLIETRAEGVPREFWEVCFPLIHRVDIERLAAEFGLDPLLVAAVIREESRFEEDAVSRAGAIGLLQLMPSTAKDEARRLGMHTRNLDLFDPPTNLRLGTYSLARRLERFDGNLVAALAGYNAGDHRVRRWRDRLKGLESDEFIDQMPYLETRLYVKRILASYEHYRRIYGPRGRGEEKLEIGLTRPEKGP